MKILPESLPLSCDVAHYCHEFIIAFAIVMISVRGIWTLWIWCRSGFFPSSSQPSTQLPLFPTVILMIYFSEKRNLSGLYFCLDVTANSQKIPADFLQCCEEFGLLLVFVISGTEVDGRVYRIERRD